MACVGAGALTATALGATGAGISPLEGGRHYQHYPCHSLASGQMTWREHSPLHQQKIGVKIY